MTRHNREEDPRSSSSSNHHIDAAYYRIRANVFNPGEVVLAGVNQNIRANGNVPVAVDKRSCCSADGGVQAATHVALERGIPECAVAEAIDVAAKRVATECIVGVAVDVGKKRRLAKSIILIPHPGST